jgi:hypothetical protein
MTVINAIKFNKFSGGMVCDEERTLDLKRRLCTVDKIQCIVPDEVLKEQNVCAFLGNTGTLSYGHELQTKIRDYITSEYQKEKKKLGYTPDKFMTIPEIAEKSYSVMCDIKHRLIDEMLIGKFGFATKDYVQGFYKKENKKYDITTDEILKGAEECITWKKRDEFLDRVFINLSLIAGFDPQNGFQMFRTSLASNICEPCTTFIQSEGSGTDACEIYFSELLRRKTQAERREGIDPVEGVIALVQATNVSLRVNIGIGGYFNIIIMDMQKDKPEDRAVEINDNRAKLAMEIVDAMYTDFITEDNCKDLISRLIFLKEPFEKVHRKFFMATKKPVELGRYLRGQK